MDVAQARLASLASHLVGTRIDSVRLSPEGRRAVDPAQQGQPLTLV
jgi:hypothetical protein